jgi:hypothetical protein
VGALARLGHDDVDVFGICQIICKTRCGLRSGVIQTDYSVISWRGQLLRIVMERILSYEAAIRKHQPN